MIRVAANGRCKFHGGHSTGPRTQEGRNRIARAQRERWRIWKAKNPKLFPDVKPRQERHIKRLYRQRQAMQQRDTRPWIERELGENWREIMEDQLRELEAESSRVRERNKPLTPEQIAQADAFLERWGSLTTPRQEAPTTRPADNNAQKLQAQIERQPSHRIKRLAYSERQESTQAHAQELIERYDLNRRRPTVRVGYASKKRR